MPEVALHRLTGQMLADVVQRKGATAGSLDGWGWRETKVLPVAWFARILPKVEEIGVWREGLLDACIALIPKADGDANSFWSASVDSSPGGVSLLGLCPNGAAGGMASVLGS